METWDSLPRWMQRMAVWSGTHDAWTDPRIDPNEAKWDRWSAIATIILSIIVIMVIMIAIIRTGAQAL